MIAAAKAGFQIGPGAVNRTASGSANIFGVTFRERQFCLKLGSEFVAGNRLCEKKFSQVGSLQFFLQDLQTLFVHGGVPAQLSLLASNLQPWEHLALFEAQAPNLIGSILGGLSIDRASSHFACYL